MQRLEVSGAVRPIYVSLGVKRLIIILIISVESLPLNFIRISFTRRKARELPVDDQEPKPNHVGAVINK